MGGDPVPARAGISMEKAQGENQPRDYIGVSAVRNGLLPRQSVGEPQMVLVLSGGKSEVLIFL